MALTPLQVKAAEAHAEQLGLMVPPVPRKDEKKPLEEFLAEWAAGELTAQKGGVGAPYPYCRSRMRDLASALRDGGYVR